LFSSFTLNIAFGNVSRTVAMTSIASSFDNLYPILPGFLFPAVAPSLHSASINFRSQPLSTSFTSIASANPA
jgi:hypothetical protein